MSFNTWVIENHRLILNVSQVLKNEATKAVYDMYKADGEYMNKIFRYIDYLSDDDSYVFKNGLTKEEAHTFAVVNSQLPNNYTPHRIVEAAIEYLYDFNINYIGDTLLTAIRTVRHQAKLLELLEAANSNILSKDSINGEDVAIITKNINIIDNIAEGLPKKVKTLQSLYDEYRNSKGDSNLARGGKTIKESMKANRSKRETLEDCETLE